MSSCWVQLPGCRWLVLVLLVLLWLDAGWFAPALAGCTPAAPSGLTALLHESEPCCTSSSPACSSGAACALACPACYAACRPATHLVIADHHAVVHDVADGLDGCIPGCCHLLLLLLRLGYLCLDGLGLLLKLGGILLVLQGGSVLRQRLWPACVHMHGRGRALLHAP